MELLCPLCQNKLTIDDQYAGQVLKCQMCSGMFQAPTLPVSPTAPLSVTPAPAPTFALEEPRPGPAPTVAAPPPPPVGAPPGPPPHPEAPPASPPLPPLPDGFTHIYKLTFNQTIISSAAVVALGLIFMLSFFTWTIAQSDRTWSKKELAVFKDNFMEIPRVKIEERESMWSFTFLLYTIFYFLTLIVAVFAMLLDKKVISLPAGMKKVRPWRSLIVAGLAAVGLFSLLIQWATTLNFNSQNPNTVVFSVVLFLQFLVVAAPLLEYWLQQRKKDEKPIPKIELRW